MFEDKNHLDKFLKILYISTSQYGKNINIMTFIEWMDYGKYSQMLKILKKLFGNHLCKFNDTTKLVAENGMTNIKNIKKLIDARVVVVETAEITDKMFTSIVIDKSLKYEKDDIETENNLKFHTICFCKTKPKMSKIYEKNTVTINISNAKNDDLYDEFINDLFLYTLERIEIKHNVALSKKISFNDVKCKDEKYSFNDFFNECIIIDKNSKEKTVDVFEKYKKWIGNKTMKENISHALLRRRMEEINAEIKYSNSMRFKLPNENGEIETTKTSGFCGIKIRN
jgi:hypothetical protein